MATSLYAKLLSFWSLDGVLTDSKAGLTLTAANAPSATTGIASYAQSYALVAASSQSLARADEVSLSMGSGKSRTVIGCFQMTTKAATAGIYTKDDFGGAEREKNFYYDQAADRFKGEAWNAVGTLATSTCTNSQAAIGTPTGEPLWCIQIFDDARNTWETRIADADGQVLETEQTLSDIRNTTALTRIGAFTLAGNGNTFLNGIAGPWMEFSTPLSHAEIEYVINGGGGRDYDQTEWTNAFDIGSLRVTQHFGPVTFDGVQSYELGSPSLTPASAFNPTNYDHFESYCLEAVKLGATAVSITAKFWDGCALFDSATNAYNTVDATPFARDVLADFVRTARIFGLEVDIYYCVKCKYYDDVYAGGLTIKQWTFNQLTEILDGTYGDIRCLFLDGYGDNFWAGNDGVDETDIPWSEMKAHVRALQPDCLLLPNDHHITFEREPKGDIGVFEEPIDSEPAAGLYHYPQFFHHNPTAKSGAEGAGDAGARWFQHDDSPDEDATDAQADIGRIYRMKRDGYCEAINFSCGPTGQVSAATKAFLAEFRRPGNDEESEDLFVEGSQTNLQAHGDWSLVTGNTAVINPSGECWISGLGLYQLDGSDMEDHWCELDFKFDTVDTNCFVGIFSHMGASDNRFYVTKTGGTIELALYDYDGVTLSQLDTATYLDGFTTATTYRLRIGKIGDELRGEFWVPVNGTLTMQSKLMATSTVTSSGPMGFQLSSSIGTSTTGIRVTGFRVYEVDVTAPAPPTLELVEA
jgi:hypothetical protein